MLTYVIWGVIFILLMVVPVATPLYKRIHNIKDPNNRIKKINNMYLMMSILIIAVADIFLIKYINILAIPFLDFALLILAILIISIRNRIYMNRLIKKHQKEKMERLNGK